MRIGIEDLFRNIAYFFLYAEYRTFIYLSFVCRSTQRGEKVNVRLLSKVLWITDKASFLWQYYEIFFKKFYFFRTNKTSPTIIDCGSNIGLSILFFKTQYPKSKVIGFEADPSIFQILQHNVGDLDGVLLKNEAVWIHNDGVVFVAQGNDEGYIAHRENKEEKTNSSRLKDVISENSPVDFLKLDIEGAEFDVLADIEDVLPHVKNIFVECHSRPKEPQRYQEALEVLSRSGFRYSISRTMHKMKPFTLFDNSKQGDFDDQINVFATRIEGEHHKKQI